MAVYKVPQDVEAEDKLIGPFSFRQFIYLIIVAVACWIAWVLSQLFIGLVIIPLPVILLFGALALPLRKDQPMEIYLTAIIKFLLKPRLRLWSPEGSVNLVTIIAPKVVEETLVKDFTEDEARKRLSYLAQVIDTQGWASRGVMAPPANTNLNDTIAAEAMEARDVLDSDIGVGHELSSLIEEQDAIRKQMITKKIHDAAQADDQGSSGKINDTPQQDTQAKVHFNPYPVSMRQRVIHPRGQSTKTSAQPSDKLPSPDIIRLANNNDLSISAIAREAHRLEDKTSNEEVVVSLRK